ncbi:hypothetical protein KPL71_004039 [Citrus sinensis]|uniref:Uncharacterized protein n=1 Tax=Citrus sinensis TaxID=2711 RepID=A0ACB8N3T3_CITSI|nr:hypothetical protein KPL71_004039 [Citrus sinensis]
MLKALNKTSHTLELIDAIQRLGVSYHFESEIDEILGKMHKAYRDGDLWDNENDKLYYIALQFRLFRQNGYRISAVRNTSKLSSHLSCRSVRMATNKERIERIETKVGDIQDKMQRMELGINDKLAHIEATLSKIADSINTSRGSPSINNNNASSRLGREVSTGGPQHFQSKVAKLEFPRYSGDDPTEWFNRASQFFEYQESTDDQKVVLASFHLEGEANQWWQWLRRSYQDEGKVVTWEVFVEELWARFGPTDCEDFDEALSRVKQTGGLKPEISEEIRLFRPRTLKEAISLARMRDEQMTRQRRLLRSPIFNRSPTAQVTNQRASPTVPFKRLSWEEMQKRRSQGLCFNCNEKFSAGHKCIKVQLLILEADDNEESTETMQHEYETEEHDKPKITFYALAGWAAPQTMRVKAKIGPHEIIVLVDSGSTHNFINSHLANMLQLPVQPTSAFPVKVANGEKVICQGKHDKVHVLIQDIPFELTLYSLLITGLDVVLGVQWLESLGSVVCNWKQLTMDFDWDNAKRRLQGLDPQTIQATTLSEVTKDMKQGHNVFAICLYLKNEESYAVAPASMRSLLEEYSELFMEPKQLPPTREIDHQITLKEGTEPINVRPYRYAYFQKAEIKRQVNEMLSSGLIRPSTSPFSSPVLLVKKKMAVGGFVWTTEC